MIFIAFKRITIPISILALFFLLPYISVAQIQVNSITATPITCPNNGKITIDATTSNPPLLFSIISGPVIQPVQTNPVFNSLLPGSYTIKISDGAGNETTAPATVSGTYTNPDFTSTVVKPYCISGNDGSITNTLIPGAGLAPYTWQTIAPSPVIIAPQSSGTFTDIPAGNYTVRLTDACGGYKTSVITVSAPNTKNPFYGGSIANKIGCDTMNFFFKLTANDIRLPLTFKYETSSGVYHYSSATEMQLMGNYFFVNQIVPNVDYGQNVKITVYNACGDSTSYTQILRPYDFFPSYAYGNCGNDVILTFFNDPELHWTGTGFMPPLNYTVTQLPSNTVVDQGTVGVVPPDDITDTYINGFSTDDIEVGHTYRVTATDGCGDVFTKNYVIPALAPPKILQKNCCLYPCLDSVMGYVIYTSGFTNGKMVMLSGPATLGSTKPGFAYSDTYTYPDTIPASNHIYALQNLAMGTYRFKVIDDCGHEVFDSLVVQHTSNMTKEISYKKGCLGKNKIYFGAMERGKVTVTDLSTHTVIKVKNLESNAAPYNRDSILNVPSGQYEILIQYTKSGGIDFNDNIHNCWVTRDTIEIEPYQTPEMSTGNVIMCNNAINFVLIPDSTKGVPPYQYEIISGPQTFGVQSSNVFVINQPGTYVARIFDVCGNASIKQITADTISFDPIEVQATCLNRNLIFPSSTYYTYEWLMPNGQVHVGDSLILEPVTIADTGTYQISKIININGCVDTLTMDYHVSLPNHLIQTIPFCEGSTVTIAGNTYSLPGIYHDTLTSALGCDSVIVSTLTLIAQESDTIQVTICQGDSLQIAGHYHSVPGFYLDSVQNAAGCYDLLITNLSVQNNLHIVSAYICPGTTYTLGTHHYGTAGSYSDTLTSALGCDSIVRLTLSVLPYIQNTITRTICPNGSFNFAGQTLTTAGSYRDTLSTAHCDSIVILNLVVLPYKYRTINQTICQGNQFAMGGQQYSISGTYRDTISTIGCDSVITLNLTVMPYKYNAITQNICEGEVFTIGGQIISLPGIYTDTLPTSGCDSILTITLNVLPIKRHDIYESICQGENYAFNGTHYIHPGSYSDTLPTTGCDSIVTLHLMVFPNPDVNILSSAYETGNGVFVQLNAFSHNHPLDYVWTSSATLSGYNIKNPTTNIQIPTWVYVTVTDTNGCSATDGHQVQIPVTSTLYIPNSFTPNGDESNQVFRVYGTNLAEFKIMIFDRWGELIFESTDIHAGWDGTYKGKIVQDGTYVYKVYAVGMDSVFYDKTGHVSVLK